MPFNKVVHLDDYDSFDNYVIDTKLKFMFLPKRCHFTGKILWLKYAYVKTAMYTGPGDPIFWYRYYDKNEFLVNRLKELI